MREFQLPKIAKESNVEIIPLLIWVNTKKTLTFWNASWHEVQDIINTVMSVRQNLCRGSLCRNVLHWSRMTGCDRYQYFARYLHTWWFRITTKCLIADYNVSYSIIMLKRIQICMWSLHLISRREKNPQQQKYTKPNTQKKKGKKPLISLFIDNFLCSQH